MTNDGAAKRGGYANAPKDTQFKTGEPSANPAGRPPKANAKAKAAGAAMSVQLENMVMEECLRPIELRENDKPVALPLIQMVIRSMGVSAVKGDLKAQIKITEMFSAVQTKRHDDLTQMFQEVLAYKAECLAEFAKYDDAGEPRPDPVPHPDEIVVDSINMAVTFNGPMSPDEKAKWDGLLARRDEALSSVALGKKELARRPAHARMLEMDIEYEQQLADMIGGTIPDEARRRDPDFNIHVWRERNNALVIYKRFLRLSKRRRIAAEKKLAKQSEAG